MLRYHPLKPAKIFLCVLPVVLALLLLVSHASTQPAGSVSLANATPTREANTPTPLPSPTPLRWSRRPEPLNNPAKYRLADWDQQKALDLVSTLDHEWNQIKQEIDGVYAQTSINEDKEVIALSEQEALARYSAVPDQERMAWKTALDLAVSGHQEATPRIARLLQSALNHQPSLIDHSFSSLQDTGFSFDVQDAPGLFPGQPGGWILMVRNANKEYDMEGQGGGAVFSIHKSADQTFQVYPVGGYWLAFWGDAFTVMIHPSSPQANPQVSVFQSASHGTPASSMTESWLCMYQWQDNQWKPVLSHTNSEASGTVGTEAFLDEACFVAGGVIDNLSFTPGKNGLPETVQLTRVGDPYSCDWWITYQFIWENGAYQQQAVVDDRTPGMMDSREAYCFFRVWNLGRAVQNKEEVISMMQNTLDTWPDLAAKDAQNQYYRTGLFTNTDFHREVLFQLGRFYALSGDQTRAHAHLNQIAVNANNISDRWVYIARHYVSHLDNIDEAEADFASDTALAPCLSCDWYDQDGAIFDRFMDALTVKGSLHTVKKEILSLIDRANPACYGGINYSCAGLFYMLGLANEIEGNTSEAVSAYWLVWRDYPTTMYAVAAQKKLERR